MALSTHSKFIYGLEVTKDNMFIEWREGLTLFQEAIPPGYYSPTTLIREIYKKMNFLSSNLYDITYDPATMLFTITSSGVFDLLTNTGDYALSGIYSTLGLNVAADYLGVTSITGINSAAKIYKTQFYLQDYVESRMHSKHFDAVVNKSTANITEFVGFGKNQTIEFTLQYITNRQGHGMSFNDCLRDNVTGVEDALEFLEWAIVKGHFDFYPDENDETNFKPIINETTGTGSNGTEFILVEETGKNLPKYFKTNKLTFGVLKYVSD